MTGYEQRLATIFHISDLHIGDSDQRSDDAALNSAVSNWWSLHKVFHGYFGHHGIALKQVQQVFDSLQSEDPVVVVTGDLTATGHPYQFDAALDYLSGRFQVMGGQHIGLNAAALLTPIPGNHDHWPGLAARHPLDLVMCGDRTPAFDKTFADIPFWRRQLSLAGGYTLTVIGIDTTADIRSGRWWRWNQFWARGDFLTQIEKVEANLGTLSDAEVRVLLLHHSPANTGYTLGMSKRSRAALNRLIERTGISVMLSGHMHLPEIRANDISHRECRWKVLECRSGTATLRDELPIRWANKKRRLDPNTIMIHRIYEVNGIKLQWRTQVLERFGFVGFDETRSFKSSYRQTIWPILS